MFQPGYPWWARGPVRRYAGPVAGGGFLNDFAGGGRSREPGDHRGKRLGLPEQGSGSVASFGGRVAAFLVDVVTSGLVAALIRPVDPETASADSALVPFLVFLAATVLGITLAGQTLGQRLVSLRVRPLDDDLARVGLGKALLRTLLLYLLIPALIMDRDGRGLHDRFTGTVVVRS